MTKHYIIDYFNIFSDYREIYYKKHGIDFHSVKHKNLEKDTFCFFDIFFSSYSENIGLDMSRQFVFVVKKLHKYTHILEQILQKYRHLDIKFLLVPDRIQDKVVEKNKDDFVCQYMICLYGKDSVLISNDKYADTPNYIQSFMTQKMINIQVLVLVNDVVRTQIVPFIISCVYAKEILEKNFKRCAIPKQKLVV
jgi:hypothetical protein